ncbi:hypothetical protein BOW53_15960 [Solemya pervernicosa gill symbiont]|uniref:Uncharacterized protein n=2 Tax=Solemya pervernicosa gill symbiont TaxID=642797 RepID=A0A1T2KZS7_9GAMM|nr:hypothetical protein BOW53_15960 [Solemya pervernicosa gill symbiont]
MEFYDIYTGEIREIIASMEYGANGEIACASFDGKKCLSAKDHDVSEIEYDKNLKALVCGPQKTYFPFGQVPSVSREMDWCGEIYLQKRFFSATPSGAGWGLMELDSQHYLTNYTHGPDGEVTCILRKYDKSCLNLASFMPYNPSTKPVLSKRHLDRMSIYACKPGERVSGPGAADVDVCGHALSVKNGIQQNLNSLYVRILAC